MVSPNAEHVGVRGGVATGAGSSISESVFPKSVYISSTEVRRFDHSDGRGPWDGLTNVLKKISRLLFFYFLRHLLVFLRNVDRTLIQE